MKYMEKEILESITKIIGKIKKEVPKEKITPDAEFVKDLEFDSLDITELVIDLEDEFHFDLVEKNAKGVVTIQDLVDTIIKLVDKSKISN